MKSLPGRNTLAYYTHSYIMNVIFITLGYGKTRLHQTRLLMPQTRLLMHQTRLLMHQTRLLMHLFTGRSIVKKKFKTLLSGALLTKFHFHHILIGPISLSVHYTKEDWLAGNKHSSLFGLFMGYKENTETPGVDTSFSS